MQLRHSNARRNFVSVLMMNGFEKHGIEHLSASSINLWSNAPDVWVMSYLFKKRTPMGAAAWRGICSEDAVVAALTGSQSLEDATQSALNKFDKRFIIGDEKTTKERAVIAPMVANAVEALKGYGKPEFPEDGSQHKISIKAKGDGWSIPVIGYLDMVFPDSGMVVDLKTTNRIMSVMSAEHQLQRAIYQKAMGNMGVKFLYVSKAKSVMLEDGDVNETLAKAKLKIARLEKFLSVCDAETARAIVPVNPNTFYWSGSEALREEMYGI